MDEKMDGTVSIFKRREAAGILARRAAAAVLVLLALLLTAGQAYAAETWIRLAADA